jgi:signal transduction histidine kinase
MRRRIVTTILVIVVLAVVGFGVPLGVTIAHLYRDEAFRRLERDATTASVEVPASARTSGQPIELPTMIDGSQLAAYDTNGTRLAGDGPSAADPVVLTALQGAPVARRTQATLEVALPLTSDEHVYAVVRAATPERALVDRIHRAWLAMGALALAVLAFAALFAARQARRLSGPVVELASVASRLGDGDFGARASPSGVPEVDAAAGALGATAERLGRLVQRERAFSADASHQLRTPLAGLRVQLESALLTPDVDPRSAIEDALGAVDQLESIIDDLLSIGRDVAPPRAPLDLARVLREAEERWQGTLASRGRRLEVALADATPSPPAAEPAVRQVLDVLIGNALGHGDGTVHVAARPAGGGVAIEVTDEGKGVRGDPNAIFDRRTDAGVDRGIGLSLARSLAEAEGGRLVLRAVGPRPTFRLLLPASS